MKKNEAKDVIKIVGIALFSIVIVLIGAILSEVLFGLTDWLVSKGGSWVFKACMIVSTVYMAFREA